MVNTAALMDSSTMENNSDIKCISVSHLFKIKPDYFLTLFLSEGGEK